LAPIVGRESPSESYATNRVRSGLCSRERGLSQVDPDVTRGREVGGVFRVIGVFATAVIADSSTVSPLQVRAQVVGLPCEPSLVLAFSRRTYEGFPRLFCLRSKPLARPSWPSPLRQRHNSIRAASFILGSSWLTSGVRERLLSWGFPKISSPPASASHVRTGFRRIWSRVVAHPSSRSCQTPRAIRPCRSSRLRRFTPCDPLQVYCTLQPVLRFAPFQIASVIAPARLRAVRPTLLILPGSAVFLHTLQSFPLVVRRTASPRPLPSRRLFMRPQGFARPTSPLSFPGVATRPDPLLSWASFPFRVLPSRSACNRNARTGPARTGARPSLVLPRNRGLDSKLSVALAGVICRILNWIAPEPCTTPDRYRRSDLPWVFLLHPLARERTRRHASRPFEDHTDTIGGVFPIFWVSRHLKSPLLRQTSHVRSPCLAENRRTAAVSRAYPTALVHLQASGGRKSRRPQRRSASISDVFPCLRSESAHITSFPANVANPR